MTTVSYRNYTGSAAEKYERYFVPAIPMPVSVPLLDAAALKPGERVLDVACGTGVIARLAAQRVGPTGLVTGVDISPDMIDVAQSIDAPASPVINWHVSDAASLPLPDRAYDVVLCQLGLMFIEDRHAALTEARRVLTEGGRVAISTPGPITKVFEVLEEGIVEHIAADLGGFVRAIFSLHDPDALISLVGDAGFHDVTAGLRTIALQLPRPAEFLWQYINITPLAPFVAQASPDRQAAMEQQVLERWEPYVVDGKLRVDQPMVITSARR